MYYRLMDKVFADQIDRNIKVYINDMVIKSHHEVALLGDIEETFRTLTQAHMKLNPGKCTFRIETGQFLAY